MDIVLLDDEDLAEISALHIHRGGLYTWKEIIEYKRLPIPAEALRKRVARYESRNKLRLGLNKQATVISSSPKQQQQQQEQPALNINSDLKVIVDYLRSLDLRLSAQEKKAQTSELYEPYPEELDDTADWERYKVELAARKSYASIMIWSDLHIPDQSIEAINLATKLLKEVQPDILIYNGDLFDFDIASTFAKSRRRKVTDMIKESRQGWYDVVDAAKAASPETKQVAYKGNHDNRLDRWNDSFDNPFAETTTETFVDMVRRDGTVWWLGQLQETHIAGLFVQHGKRTGENAAKNASKDQGWGTPTVQGHNHKPGFFVHRVNSPWNTNEYRVVMSCSSGALCNIPPHYQQDTQQSTWLHGIILAHVNMHGTEVNLQNIVFHRDIGGKLWTALGEKLIFSD